MSKDTYNNEICNLSYGGPLSLSVSTVHGIMSEEEEDTFSFLRVSFNSGLELIFWT